MPTFREDTKIGGMVPMMKTDDINDQAITKDKIRDGNVTAEKLADGAVSTDKLPDGAIKTPKIADENITTSKLAEASVVTSKIADRNVTKEKIADQSIDNSKLSPEAVTYDKLKDKSVITEKLNDRAVTTEKVDEKAITNAKLGDQSVDGRVVREASIEGKHIGNNAVSTSKIASRSVTNEKIAYNSVSRAELTPDVRNSIDKKADAEQVNNSLYDLEKKIGDRFVVEGDVTNLPDEEDLTSVKESERDVLKLADRSYAPEKFSGKGYKILRRNINPVSIAVTKIRVESAPSTDGTLSFSINGKETQVAISATTDNTTELVAQKVASALQESMTEYDVSIDASLITLTRKSNGSVTPSVFSANTTGVVCTITDSTKREYRNILIPNMINQSNTIYEIRYDFDLNGGTINFPENCILKFEGGCLNNGNINFNNTSLESSPVQIFNNIEISGEANIDKSYCEWFGGGFNCDDSTNAIKQALKLKANEFIFYKGIYNISDTLIFDYSNIRINQTATVKAIANMDCLILFDFKNKATGGIYGISTLNYITGGGCVDGNGLANICIALDNILHSRVYNLKIKNGKLYCLELDYEDYSPGYCYINDLEIYNELLIKDAIGIHANKSDSSFSNIQLVDFKYSIFAERNSKYYHVHGWALHSNFYLDNDCEIWKESALIKLKNIQDIHLICCVNDTLRYLVTKDKEDVEYKPTLYPLYCYTYNNSDIIPSTIIKQYPQEIVSSKDININKFLSSFKFDNIASNIFKITVDKNFVASVNLMFFGFNNANLSFTFSMTSNKNIATRIYLNCLFDFITVYYDTTEDYINVYLNIKGTYIYNTFCANNASFENVETIPDTAINLSEINTRDVILYSNYFKKLGALNNFRYINSKFLTYVEDIDKFVFIYNKTFKYLSLKETTVTSGTTNNRPTVTDIGFQYFDTTLNSPIWWTGTKWVRATGADV